LEPAVLPRAIDIRETTLSGISSEILDRSESLGKLTGPVNLTGNDQVADVISSERMVGYS
jgi:hypothetical protein